MPDSSAMRMKLGMHEGKVAKVMHEFREGMLHSGSGAKVKKRSQAIAIAMHESGMAKKGRKKA